MTLHPVLVLFPNGTVRHTLAKRSLEHGWVLCPYLAPSPEEASVLAQLYDQEDMSLTSDPELEDVLQPDPDALSRVQIAVKGELAWSGMATYLTLAFGLIQPDDAFFDPPSWAQ